MLSLEYRAFLEDLFAGLGAVEVRRLFDFDGLFCEGTIFGLVSGGRVFLKTDAQSRGDFESKGSRPFTYRARDGTNVQTSYYELPALVFDDPGEGVRWARRAWEVALRSPTTRRKKRGGVKQKARLPKRKD
jgi:DNA transformation protein